MYLRFSILDSCIYKEFSKCFDFTDTKDFLDVQIYILYIVYIFDIRRYFYFPFICILLHISL